MKLKKRNLFKIIKIETKITHSLLKNLFKDIRVMSLFTIHKMENNLGSQVEVFLNAWIFLHLAGFKD